MSTAEGLATVYKYARDPRSLTGFLVVMLWVSLVCDIVSLTGDSMQMSLLSGDFDQEEAEANDQRQAIIGVCSLAAIIVTGITFLRWQYVANLNCHAFGAKEMEFSSGWAVGCYFVPILNLVRPYQAMREIWQVSHNPKDWKAVPAASILSTWWGLWIVTGVLNQVVFRMSRHADTIDLLKLMTGLSMAASVSSLILTLVALQVVKGIAAAQERLVSGAAEDGSIDPSDAGLAGGPGAKEVKFDFD